MLSLAHPIAERVLLISETGNQFLAVSSFKDMCQLAVDVAGRSIAYHETSVSKRRLVNNLEGRVLDVPCRGMPLRGREHVNELREGLQTPQEPQGRVCRDGSRRTTRDLQNIAFILLRVRPVDLLAQRKDGGARGEGELEVLKNSSARDVGAVRFAVVDNERLQRVREGVVIGPTHGGGELA